MVIMNSISLVLNGIATKITIFYDWSYVVVVFYYKSYLVQIRFILLGAKHNLLCIPGSRWMFFHCWCGFCSCCCVKWCRYRTVIGLKNIQIKRNRLSIRIIFFSVQLSFHIQLYMPRHLVEYLKEMNGSFAKIRI